jgi:phospholipid/cholesterol/gamma-HCH transport system ATP-binding protein
VRALGLGPEEAARRADAALDAVGLSTLASRAPPEVGPGARKQASIARALGLAPEAVLYDEPTAGLDAGAARAVDRLIRRTADLGATAVVVSHDLASLRLIGERVALLDGGRVAFQGGVGDFFAARDEHPAVRRFFHQGEDGP